MTEHFNGERSQKPHFSVSCQHYSFALNAFVDVIRKYKADSYSFTLRETQTYEIIDDVFGEFTGEYDAVAILQYLANSAKYPLSEQGKKNVDVDGVAGVSGLDALTIQKFDAKVIDKL